MNSIELSEKALEILKKSEPMSPRELAEALGVEAHAATLALRVLQRAGKAGVEGLARAAKWRATTGMNLKPRPIRKATARPKVLRKRDLKPANGAHAAPLPEPKSKGALRESLLAYAAEMQEIAGLVGQLLEKL